MQPSTWVRALPITDINMEDPQWKHVQNLELLERITPLFLIAFIACHDGATSLIEQNGTKANTGQEDIFGLILKDWPLTASGSCNVKYVNSQLEVPYTFRVIKHFVICSQVHSLSNTVLLNWKDILWMHQAVSISSGLIFLCLLIVPATKQTQPLCKTK